MELLFFVAAAGVLLSVFVSWQAFCEPVNADTRLSATSRVRIVVGTVYAPDQIRLRAGRRARLVFIRHHGAPSCADRVVVPDFGVSAHLPLGRAVAFEIAPPGPGEYEFACPEGNVRGSLVVV